MRRPDASSVTQDAVPSSELFRQLAEQLEGSRVSVGELIDALAGRGVGLLLLVCSLPLCVPNIPGISTLFGILLIAPSLQIMTRSRSVWMPEFARKWQLKGENLRAVLRACSKLLRRFEVVAKPRIEPLTRWPVTGFIGLQTLVMALVLLIPMPGANVIPGIAVALTGLALLQRDGVLMVLSTAVALVALAWVYLGGRYVIGFGLWAYEICVHFIGRLS
jgi:hypothetical protein